MAGKALVVWQVAERAGGHGAIRESIHVFKPTFLGVRTAQFRRVGPDDRLEHNDLGRHR